MGTLDWGTLSPEDLPGEWGEIAEAIGMDATRTLIQGWAGVRLYVPALRELQRERLAARAMRLLADGKTKAEVCRILRITRARLNALLGE